jgi:hypothetical protein
MKSQIRSWLARAEFHRVVEIALAHDRTVAALIALTYDVEPLVCWRAVDAIGRCAKPLSQIRPEGMKNHLRRLFWMRSDESGTVAWHAPEAIGEIVRANPILFSDFIPMAISMLELEPEDRPPFLPGILYALGRIGEIAPDSMDACLPQIYDALAEPDAQTRAMAVCCLGRLRANDLLLRRHDLADDQGKAIIYHDEHLIETTISALLSDVLACRIARLSEP